MHLTRLELVNCDQHTSNAVAQNVRTRNPRRGTSCCMSHRWTGTHFVATHSAVTRWAQTALPLCALFFVPKCPACLAVLLAAGTGLSLSFQTAAQVRFAIIAACLVAAVLIWRRNGTTGSASPSCQSNETTAEPTTDPYQRNPAP